MLCCFLFFFFQAEDGIRDFCLSRGLGDVYKRQVIGSAGASDASRTPSSETVEGADQDNTGAGWAVWLVVALVVGLGVFAFLSTGGRGGMSKWGRSLSEMTGGLFGKKPPRE